MDTVTRLREQLDRDRRDGSESTETVIELLSAAWSTLAGSDQEAMDRGKLPRIESLAWEPPRLTFTIERHGAVVLGSSRAQVQTWVVDLDNQTAELVGRTQRQVHAVAPRLDIEPIAQELARLIAEDRTDERLQWNADRSTVRIIAAKCLASAGEQTMAGRRKRLWAKVDALLEPRGWSPGNRPGSYARKRVQPPPNG